MFDKISRLFFLLGVINTPYEAQGSAVSLVLGPPSVGKGGPNPISLPPSGIDFGLTYVTDSNIETNLSITGFFFGKRYPSSWGGYVSLGAGLVISANGSGFGMYSNFGVDFSCGLFCFNAVYQSGLGIAPGSRIVSPYAIRVGVSKWF